MGDLRLSRKLTMLALFGLAVGLLAFAGTIGGEATYEGSSRCGDCHDDVLGDWEATMHGIDFTNWDYHGELTNKYTLGGGNTTTGMTGYCTECHTTGYGETDIGGFDPALPWNDTYNAGDDGENLHLLRIGCENCHGPGSDHVSSKDAADIDRSLYSYSTSCGNDGRGCHGDGRQWGNDTLKGYGASDHLMNEAPAYAQRASCSVCRSTQGFISHLDGEDWEEVPEDVDVIWRVTCMACHDPHPEEGEENHFQLRMEPEDLCEECHMTTSSFGTETVHHPQAQFRNAELVYTTEPVIWMKDIECVNCHMFQSGRGTPNDEFKMGHSFDPHMEACMECHSMYETPEDARAAVDHIQHAFHEAIEPAMVALGAEQDDGTYTGIKALKRWAQGNESVAGELWTDELELAYSEAHWDLTFVEHDASGGFHNPTMAMGMVRGSMERIDMINEAMAVGGVSGKLTWTKSGDAIEGAKLKDCNDVTVATTDAEGAYFFWAPSEDLAYNIYDVDGKLIGASMIGANAQANVTMDIGLEKATGGTVDTNGDDDDFAFNTLSYVFIGIIVLLIVILVAVSMMGKKE
jgi:predicted CXXCH cytochrome family protein